MIIIVLYYLYTENEVKIINNIRNLALESFGLQHYTLKEVKPHFGGRNHVYICLKNDKPEYVVRISNLHDRTYEDYLSEVEFVNYLAEKGAPVVRAIPSVDGSYVKRFEIEKEVYHVCVFTYAKGMQISENGYQYLEGIPIQKYFYDTGKALGAIHDISKSFKPINKRKDYFERYNTESLNNLFPKEMEKVKHKIFELLETFKSLNITENNFGLIHYDFSDGNYNIDYDTGEITVYDFDNSLYCWYMADLANVWAHGIGWFQHIEDGTLRLEQMTKYFNLILEGYRSKTSLDEEDLMLLQTFLDLITVESIVDHLEVCRNNNIPIDYESIEDDIECILNGYPYLGFGM